ncbi:SGNH/GDSL hydrolase family protein [Azospirillum humicireducens]|nr:SGNH/GDSL hydrolase family protein [Azospirillum humicireducens]
MMKVHENEHNGKILFFGDSICFGEGVSPQFSFVGLVSVALESELGNRCPRIINHSINGDTTRMALDRVAKDLQAECAETVYLQFGLNDCNYWHSDRGLPRVSANAFVANLTELVIRSHQFGARKVFLATNHRTEPDGPLEHKRSPLAPNSYLENLIIYNQLIRTVADLTGSVLIDIERAWLEEESLGRTASYLNQDGIHLSRHGNDFYGKIILPFIKNSTSISA